MNKTKFYDERLFFPTKLAKVPGGIVEVLLLIGGLMTTKDKLTFK